MNPKLIKSEEEYEKALERINELMDAGPGSSESDELELWTTLVMLYEKENFPVEMPDPVEAIKFRMEQQGLRQKDLIPYIGSASKVSEVLSGKRGLSRSMIRRLHEGLGIPAEVLLREPDATLAETGDLEWQKFPVAEMIKRGWIEYKGTTRMAKKEARKIMLNFIKPLDQELLSPTFLRSKIRQKCKMDLYNLTAWRIRVMKQAMRQKTANYETGTVCRDFLKELVKLSLFNKGPLLAKEYLLKHGIHLVTERHLPKTYLDGAAILMPDGTPLVAMTLRYDRLDNFWFTLIHELSHIALHLKPGADEIIFDDLNAEQNSAVEKEADEYASDCMIPQSIWKNLNFNEATKRREITETARELKISPAIIAGRIRHETGDFSLFSRMVGNKTVRVLFE